MNIWKNLDKITAQIQKRSVKVLMLDFDGTLVPIAKSPKEAELSIKTKKLLQKLYAKPDFYLAIISGRSLKDIKEKVGLPNIIYGASHGLEGEIFQEKFCYPISDQTLKILETIYEQLNKIAIQFSGVIVENKGQELAFHYRLVGQEYISEVKSSFKKTLEPYTQNGLISIAEEKMSFDIQPKVNWNKGNFAALIFKEITAQIATPPVAIVIGDDTTDEDIFQRLENQITITIGEKQHSKAKYYLKNVNEVFRFLEWVTIQQ